MRYSLPLALTLSCAAVSTSVLADEIPEISEIKKALTKFDATVQPTRPLPAPNQPYVPRILTDEKTIQAAAGKTRMANVNEIGASVQRTTMDRVSQAMKDQFNNSDGAKVELAWNDKYTDGVFESLGIAGRLEDITEAAFVHYATTEPALKDKMAAEIRNRLRALAPAITARACSENPFYAREYVFSLSLAYDLAPSVFLDGQSSTPGSPTDVKLLENVISACVKTHFKTITAKAATQSKTSGIDFNSVAKFAAGLLLLRGDAKLSVGNKDSEAQTLVENALTTYIPGLPNFGEKDGGYINGSSYFIWDSGESLLPWDVFKRVLKYDVYAKPYVANLPEFLAWTLPPGTPIGVFGDGAEVSRAEDWGRIARSVMNRYNTAESKYWLKLLEEHCPQAPGLVNCGDLNRLHYVLSPVPDLRDASKPTKLSKLFPDSGFASFHNDRAALGRLSIHFKSSPLGAANHGHADQNTFTIFKAGVSMTTDGGVYDDYNTLHRLNYGKQSVAHNVVTYGDGVGQSAGVGDAGDILSTGKIDLFNKMDGVQIYVKKPEDAVLDTTTDTLKNSRGTVYNVVRGDATEAYRRVNTGITKAVRTMILVRKSNVSPADTLIVFDQLESSSPQLWQYNVHFPVKATEYPYNAQADRPVELLVNVKGETTTSSAKMCVNVRGGSDLQWNQVRPYDNPKYPLTLKSELQATAERDYWNVFKYTNASTKGYFVSVYRFDCASPLQTQNINKYVNGISVSAGLFDPVFYYDNGKIEVK